MNRSILSAALAATFFFSIPAYAQPLQTINDGSTGSLQTIGDVSNDRSNSTSTQINPSANSNGNDLSNQTDIRTQISPTINPNTSSNATGLALGNNSDAKASNGDQTMGAVGNSMSGGNTLSNGPNTNTNTAAGGVGHGGQGGGGGTGTASANGGAGGSSNAMGGTSGAVSGSRADGGRSNATGGTSGAAARSGDQQQGQSTRVGGQSSSNRASTDGSGNSRTEVDASDRSSNSYKAIFIPPVVPPTPASTLAVGNIVKETSACGPLQKVVETTVVGTFHGFFWDSKIEQGKHQELTYFTDEQGNIVDFREVPIPGGIGYRLYGHQVTQYTAVVGVSGARNVALGGGGGSGDWGQAGGGASSSMQQIVTTLQLRSCLYADYHYQATQPLEVFMTKRIRN